MTFFMHIFFDPLNPACKSVTGAVARGEALQLNLFYMEERPKGGDGYRPCPPLSPEKCVRPDSDAILLLKKDGEAEQFFSMSRTEYGWNIRMKVRETGLYFYRFALGNTFLSCGNGLLGTETEFPDQGAWFQLTVYDESYRTPTWFKGGILYQIFPDRFCKTGTMSDIKGRVIRSDWGGTPSYRPNEQGKILNNDFFGGTLRGIQEKLPYLSSLHVTAVYLNPIFEAASNHRYDTSDYLHVDPYLGTEKDLRALTDEAEKYGIRIILDGVFNHTGDDSVYFNKYGHYPSLGAYQSKDSPYYSWYTFQEFPDKYSSWWGIDILPELNENSQSYQTFIFGENGVLRHWLDCGIGGYRLDVADELPDFFLKELRATVKEKTPDAVIIGEVWEDASNKIAYSKRREYLQGKELDSVMNYPLKDAIIRFMLTENAEALADTVRTLQDHYPKQTLDCLMNILGTHDTARILTVLGGKTCYTKEEMASPAMRLNDSERRNATEKLKMAAFLQYTLPGVPCVYYGDENAAEGYIDPFCRRCFDWDNLNDELIAHYRKLGELRIRFASVFKEGVYKEIFVKNGCYLFKRSVRDSVAYIFANNSAESYLLYPDDGIYLDYFQGKTYTKLIEIKPYSYGIFLRSPAS